MKRLLFAALAVALPAAAERAGHDEVPFAVAGPEGFGISSADGASRVITHWLLQSDFRSFVGADKPTADRETFVLRFAGLRLDAMLERNFRALLFANFAQNQVTLLEGWIGHPLLQGQLTWGPTVRSARGQDRTLSPSLLLRDRGSRSAPAPNSLFTAPPVLATFSVRDSRREQRPSAAPSSCW